jgi:hypothetical protein
MLYCVVKYNTFQLFHAVFHMNKFHALERKKPVRPNLILHRYTKIRKLDNIKLW